jgi:hypothetical protein
MTRDHPTPVTPSTPGPVRRSGRWLPLTAPAVGVFIGVSPTWWDRGVVALHHAPPVPVHVPVPVTGTGFDCDRGGIVPAGSGVPNAAG